jgi:hypothetical protein
MLKMRTAISALDQCAVSQDGGAQRVIGSPAIIATWTADMISPAPTPKAVKPWKRCMFRHGELLSSQDREKVDDGPTVGPPAGS